MTCATITAVVDSTGINSGFKVKFAVEGALRGAG
jgi:hypothetical protein